MSPPLFFTREGIAIPGVTPEVYDSIQSTLTNSFGISPLQISELASFSMAMVVRAALGLSATGGRSIVVVNDSLCGCVALAATRHLLNSGAEAHIYILADLGATPEFSHSFQTQLLPLKAMGIIPELLFRPLPPHDLRGPLDDAHNVICGAMGEDDQKIPFIVEALNEAAAPIHAIGAPIGVDLLTGTGKTHPMFASSTLSLGIPFLGLSSGADFAGRHYICDISLPQVLFQQHNLNMPFLFSDQPVQQIFSQTSGEEHEE